MNKEEEAKEDLLVTISKIDRGIAYYQLIATTLARAMYEVKRSDGQVAYILDPDKLSDCDVDHMTRDFIKLIRKEDCPHADANSTPVVCSESQEKV